MKMTDVAVGQLCEKIGGLIHRLDHRGIPNTTALTVDGGGFQKLVAFGFALPNGNYVWQWVAQSFREYFPKGS